MHRIIHCNLIRLYCMCFGVIEIPLCIWFTSLLIKRSCVVWFEAMAEEMGFLGTNFVYVFKLTKYCLATKWKSLRWLIKAHACQNMTASVNLVVFATNLVTMSSVESNTKPYFKAIEQLTVPSLTNLPDALVTGLAVWAVLGVLMACSMVPGRPPWVPGLTNPLRGRPDWDMGRNPALGAPWPVPGFFREVPGPVSKHNISIKNIYLRYAKLKTILDHPPLWTDLKLVWKSVSCPLTFQDHKINSKNWVTVSVD